jgi:hypothetical protein
MACVTTTLDALLLAFESRIEAETKFNASNTCYIGLNPDQNVYQPSDQYVIITPGPQSLANGYVKGTMPTTLALEGTVQVTLWSRLALDQAGRADSYLADQTYGALPALNTIISALHLFYPLDGDNNVLTLLPVKLEKIDSYAKQFDSVSWGACKVSFKVVWRMTL